MITTTATSTLTISASASATATATASATDAGPTFPWGEAIEIGWEIGKIGWEWWQNSGGCGGR